MDRIAIVGAGLAGLSVAQELRRRRYAGELIIMGEEHHRPYRRPPLSKQLLHGADADITLRHDGLDARWLLGQRATGLDLPARRILRGDAVPVEFDGLVIATGVRPRALPGIPRLAGITTLRTLEDARALKASISSRPRVVVAGAGFLGSETAATLRGEGLDVTVVDRDHVPLRRPVGDHVGELVAELHRTHGVDLRLGRTITAVMGTRRLEAVHLDDGTVLHADLLIVALGAEPATDWLEGSPVHIDGGVLVDRHAAAAPGVVAAGDIARWPHPILGTLVRFEHYSNAIEQGVRAARSLIGEAHSEPTVPSFWSDLYGRRLQAVGFTGADFDAHVIEREPGGRFLVEYRHAGRVVGAVTAGFIHRLPHYRPLIAKELT